MSMKMLFFVSFLLIINTTACNGPATEPLTKPQLEEAAAKSAKYLEGAVRKNGMFLYQINTNNKAIIRTSYNFLRHAGAIYSMNQYYEKNPGNSLRSAILSSGTYLKTTAMDKVPGEDGLLTIWSDPKTTKLSGTRQSKLGGAGLGLIALTGIEKIEPGFTAMEELRAIGKFIVFMQKENGSYYSRYFPDQIGKTVNPISLFYPGEAALGLLKLYEVDPSPLWVGSAIKCLEQLANSRKNETDIPIDHWSLLATSQLFSIKNIDQISFSRELLINHGIQICKKIIAEQVIENADKKMIGAFTRGWETTPTATRIEALTAALNFIPKSDSIYDEIYKSAELAINYLVPIQIDTGIYSGAFTQNVAVYKDEELPKSFWANTDIRIDYVQHALSAMIQYLDLEMRE